MFLLDGVHASSDSVSVAFPYELNLDDQLFKYGVRINKVLVQDMYSLSEPVVVGNMGDQPQIQLLPWPFYPIINTYSNHPIVRNLDAVSLKYSGSIDTVKAQGVIKTPLFFTSTYSRALKAPLQIDLDELKKPLNPSSFNEPNLAAGYLLEGQFTSVFKNRPLPAGVEASEFKESGESAMVIVSDGDIIASNINPQTGNPLPLGYDFYSRQTFANEAFLLNTIQYLIDDEGLIQSRNKEIKLRPLDRIKAEEDRVKWQIINLILPILFLVIFGMLINYFRKRKYASH